MHSIKDKLSPFRSALSSGFLWANKVMSQSDTASKYLRSQRLGNENPIITAADVTDYGHVSFVADPFLYVKNDWHLFFEVQNGRRDPSAVIGHASSSDGGITWEYDQVVLEHNRHLAFPYVFDVDGTVYMTPGQGGDPDERSVTLFEAESFPYDWQPVEDIVQPTYGPLDPIVFHYEGLWWTIVGGGDNDTLYAYYSRTLRAEDWSPHKQNPVVTSRVSAGRPAGRPIVSSEGPILFLQDNTAQYGDSVRAYRVTTLTPSEFHDEPISDQPLLSGDNGRGWNAGRSHHIDAQDTGTVSGWVCVTDGDIGFGRNIVGACWSIGAYKLEGPPQLAMIKQP